jgi:hypothetical protein
VFMRDLVVFGGAGGLTGFWADGEGLRVAVGWVDGRGWEGRLVPFGFAQGCGCAPAFGRAVGPKARRVYGTQG